MTPSVFIAIVVSCILLAAALAWWTVRCLWRPASTPREIWIYTLGVKRFGVATGALMTVTQLVRDYAQSPSLFRFLVFALFVVLVGVTIFLWGGYWWGRTMAFLMGARSEAVSSPRNANS